MSNDWGTVWNTHCLQTLAKVTGAVSENLYDMAVHKYATHVARRLLSVLAGRDVAPAPGRKQQQQAQQHAEGEAGEEKQQQQQQQAKVWSLKGVA